MAATDKLRIHAEKVNTACQLFPLGPQGAVRSSIGQRQASLWNGQASFALRGHSIDGCLDRIPGSGVTEPAEGALRAKEDGHRGSWLTLSLRIPSTHQRNRDDQAHYRIDRVG